MNYQKLIDEIETEYNPDNDIGTPQVTCTDASLLELIKDLYERIEALEVQLVERPTWAQLAEKESLLAQNGDPDPAYSEYNHIREQSGLPPLG